MVFGSRRKHMEMALNMEWLTAVWKRLYPWSDTPWKRVADQLYVAWQTILKGRRGGTYPLVNCGNKVNELCELVDFLCPAPHSEHAMSEMVNVAPRPVVKA